MARSSWCVPLLLIGAVAIGLAQGPARPAQSSVESSAQSSAQSGQGAAEGAQAGFGRAEMPLYGPWRFRSGDSPVDAATGVPLWAEPGFDDSTWEERSLEPEPGLKDPYNGDPRYVRGWTATGHPGYMGYAWYR